MMYEHYSDAEEDWMWAPEFVPKEIACHGTGSLLIDIDALNTLRQARQVAGKPFRILSAYRSPTHNARVGGAPKSAHKDGIAFDISLAGHDRQELLDVCKAAGFGSFGKYSTFLHVDMRKGRKWGSW